MLLLSLSALFPVVFSVSICVFIITNSFPPVSFLLSLSQGLSLAFAAAAEGGLEAASSFEDSSALGPPDVAAKQQHLASRLRLLLRFLADLLLQDLLPVSLEPLLLRLLALAAAAPPSTADKQQQQQQLHAAAAFADEAAWPVVSAERGSRSASAASDVPVSRAAAAAASAAAAAAAVPQGKWVYSVPLCLLRLQALGGGFCRKAAQLLLTQQQQQERLAAAVSLCLRKQQSQEETTTAAAAAADSPVPAAAPAGTTDAPGGGCAAGGGPLIGTEKETLDFEGLTAELLVKVFESEGLTLPEAEAALAALAAAPRSLPSPALRTQVRRKAAARTTNAIAATAIATPAAAAAAAAATPSG